MKTTGRCLRERVVTAVLVAGATLSSGCGRLGYETFSAAIDGVIADGGNTESGATGTDGALGATGDAALDNTTLPKRIGSALDDVVTGVRTDASGNLYVTGSLNGAVDFGQGTLAAAGNTDAFVASFTSGGAIRWAKRFGDGDFQDGYGIAVDANANVYITGRFQGTADFGGGTLTSSGASDAFVASFAGTGAFRWAKCFGGATVDQGLAIEADGNGVIVTGLFGGTIDFGGGALTNSGSFWDGFVAALAQDGSHRWSKRFGGATGPDEGHAVAVDSSGNAFVTGYFSGSTNFGGGALTSAGGNDIFVASFTSTGTHRFSSRYGGGGSDEGDAIIATGGSVFVSGYFQSTVNFGGGALTATSSDLYLLSVSSANAAYRFANRYGSLALGNALAADASSNVYLAGYVQGSVDFGNGSYTSVLDDGFVVSFTSAGAYRFARFFGSAGYERARSVAIGSNGTPYVGGSFQNTVNFGTPLTSSGGTDGFVATVAP